MTDEQGFDEDPQLRALLGQADPARSLTPADPEGLARLLEDTMSQDLDTRPELEQTTELRRRGPLAWLVAAAAVAVIAGGGYAAVSSMQDNGTVQQAGPSTSPVEPVDEPAVVTLQAPTAVPAKCAVPTPELLGGAEVAFAGTVTAIDGDVVTLTPTETFAGESADGDRGRRDEPGPAGADRPARVRGRGHLPRLGHRWPGLRVRVQRSGHAGAGAALRPRLPVSRGRR